MSSLQEKYMKVLTHLPPIVVDSTANVGRFSYKYLSLPTLLNALRPVLAEYDIQIIQPITCTDGTLYVETRIIDSEDSQTIGTYPVKMLDDPQAMGSAITYARRYSLYAALNIYPDKDDDGYAAHAQSQADTKINPKQQQQIMSFAESHGIPDPQLAQIVNQTLNRQVNGLTDINVAEFPTVKTALMNEVKK